MAILIVITVVSVAVAAVMSVVAWRLAREEQRRSDARVEAVTAEIHATPTADLFAPGPSHSHRSTVSALLIGILVVGAFVTLAVVLSRGGGPAAARSATAAPAAAAPLELLALGHEVDGDRLTVRGVVRNPAGAGTVERLAAVVFVFNREGRFVTSARAPIERPRLAAGGESTFVVTAAGLDDVGRYRVSFRSDERIVVHVDRRDRTVAVPDP